MTISNEDITNLFQQIYRIEMECMRSMERERQMLSEYELAKRDRESNCERREALIAKMRRYASEAAGVPTSTDDADLTSRSQYVPVRR